MNLNKMMIHDLKHTIHIACECITLLGAWIMIIGVLIAFINLVLCALNGLFNQKLNCIAVRHGKHGVTNGIANFDKVRKQLGDITALGLEVLVVADVLETLLKTAEEYTFETLGKLALIASFRTILAYFLSREVVEIKEQLEREFEESELSREKDVLNMRSCDHLGSDVLIHGKTVLKEE